MMKTIRSRSLVKTLVLVTILCGSASLAAAQSAIKGEFTLPFDAHWGKAVLPAGDYTFDLRSAQTPKVIQIRGQGTNVLVMAQGATDLPSLTEDSALVLVRSGGNHIVRSLRLGPLGMSLFYAPHKGEPMGVAQAPELIQRVPVHINGK